MKYKALTTDPFEHYFYEHAQWLEEAWSVTAANTLATSYLDALAEIWLRDFPDAKKKLEKDNSGKPPASIRLARFLKQFIPNDPDVNKVAVLCFAEDWKHYRPQDAHLADQIINKRVNKDPNNIFYGNEVPKAYLDVPRDELAKECPELAANPDLLALVEEYEYGAILYSLYRCPLVHTATNSNRTNGFVGREERSMYYWSLDGSGRVTIGFGTHLITRWLCNAVTGYVQACHEAGIIPANNIDAGSSQEERFKKLWSKIK
ncbi:hypothetical protein [Nostoc sp. 106C]|uniref:hypothetical protein n=1 Tax=Nostoc sp. 106C TaxID=1932667 RepID=UPI000A39A663|nr:hypothetical protein [Nostoc sp. 106C]OUL22311.1 hypothetical protein BV375_27490 [Nostoc sp. 106C]